MFFYSAAFDKVLEVRQQAVVENLTEYFDMFSTDPPNSSRMGQSCEKSCYDFLTSNEIEIVLYVVDAVLVRGCHSFMFCSDVPFLNWYCTCQLLL